MIAIADTSFLIDWAKYDNRDLIFKIFELIYLPESTLNEIRNELTLIWISQALEENRMAIFPEIPQISNEALRLVNSSRRLPIRPVGYPEAYCTVVGKIFDYVVLTENGGVAALVDYFDEYNNVKVFRAIDVIYQLFKSGLVKDFKTELDRYSNQTKHMFSVRDLRKYGIL